MTDDLLQVAKTREYWNVSGTRLLKYSVEMFHKGLNDHKIVSAPDTAMLQNKVVLQAKKWSEIWETIEEKRKINELKEASIEKALSLSQEAKNALATIDNLLIHTLSINDTIDWEKLKQADGFPEIIPAEPKAKKKLGYPAEPARAEITFTFLEKLIKSKKEKKVRDHEERFRARILEWENEKREVDRENSQQAEEYERQLQDWRSSVLLWEKKRHDYLAERDKYNQKIDSMRSNYLAKNEDSIVEYCDMVLNNSGYPVSFPKNFEIEYVPDTKILIVEYQLPSLADFPSVAEVKYIATRKELKESPIPETQRAKIFDEAIYKIALRTIHELFEADAANAIDAISLNGWVEVLEDNWVT
jgi:restriction system protein